jgi:hypothetical protein
MAQTILTVYTGDQLFKLVAPGLCVPRPYLHWQSLVIRIGGTLLGAIMAILIWYIGRHSALIRWVLYCSLQWSREWWRKRQPIWARRQLRGAYSPCHVREAVRTATTFAGRYSWHRS